MQVVDCVQARAEDFVRPVQVMGEIWRASDDPRNWPRRPGSWVIVVWWTLFLIYTGVTQVSLDVGYNSASAFIARFKKELGATPGRFQLS